MYSVSPSATQRQRRFANFLVVICEPASRRRALGRYTRVAQARDFRARRRAKQAPVFAAELRRTLVADAMASGGALDTLGEYQPPRFMPAQMLLVLQWRHRGDRFEAVMQCRCTHMHCIGQLLDA